MCNKRSERDLQTDNREYQNMNVGLVNMSKTGDGIDSSDIIICIIAAICVMMLIKWLKKCYNRCQEKMIRQLQPAQPIQCRCSRLLSLCSNSNSYMFEHWHHP